MESVKEKCLSGTAVRQQAETEMRQEVVSGDKIKRDIHYTERRRITSQHRHMVFELWQKIVDEIGNLDEMSRVLAHLMSETQYYMRAKDGMEPYSSETMKKVYMYLKYCYDVSEDHTRFWREKRNGKCTYYISYEPYITGMEMMAGIIEGCRKAGVELYITGDSTHFPNRTFTIWIEIKDPKEMVKRMKRLHPDLVV